ncbi:MAG: nitroreductase family protein [Bacteroidales bacterium]|nr:nitroreductase family protein [Bacteroidales bacterium]
MDVFEAIFGRRSVRSYTEETVTDDEIEILLKAAMYAPSAVNRQPWHLIVFRNGKTIREIINVHPNAKMLEKADVAILVCWDENLQHDAGYGPVDCAAATQNVLLAAHGLGLGAVWVGVYPRIRRIEALHKIFELPEHIKPFSVISLGHPAEKKAFPDRFDPKRVHYEKWSLTK